MTLRPFLPFLVSFAFVALACGDDDAPPSDAGLDSTADAAPDAAPDTGPPLACTELPEVVDTGMTADTDPGIDPADFETDETTITFDPTSVTESDTDFPHGIMSGAMTADSALLWTHRVGSGDTILRVYRPGATAGEIVVAYEATVTPDAEGYVHERAAGLAPATVYNYVFLVDDGMGGFSARSAIGRVRTALADDMALKLTFGATTCTGSAGGFGTPDGGYRQEIADMGYPALTMMAMEDLDALLHLGDMTYNDNAWTIAETMPVDQTDDIYRSDDAGWGFTLNVQGYRDILSSTGMYLTLDDHEVVDSDLFDPEMLDGAKLAAAIDTMEQNTAIERGPSGELWGSYQWGLTAEIIVTDLRTERRPSTIGTADPIFVSAEQMAFIKDRLMNTTAHFKLVFSSVNITNMPNVGWDASFAFNDRWEGYGAQREELLDFIVENGIDDVYFLAGDIHTGFVGRLEPDGTSPYARMWEITVGPGASADNPLGSLLEMGILGMNDVFPCDQFVFGHGRKQVTTTLELDPLADTMRVRFVDALTSEVMFDEVLQQEP